MEDSDQPNRCMLFADVSGSVTLFENVGNSTAKELISNSIALMTEIATRYSGRVVNKIGDEILACFESTDDAFDAAVGIQQAHADSPISIRIGFNYGPVIEDKGEYFGDVINVASRVVNKASGGEILTTGECVNVLSADRIPRVRHIDTNAVKGRQELIQIYQIYWRDDEDDEQTTLGTIEEVEEVGTMILRHKGTEYVINAAMTQLMLGREAANNLVTANQRASRKHASIERRGSKFILTDRSTNGTYVVNANGESTVLRRETTEIFGSGRIGLGSPPSEEDSEAIEFERVD